jgi:ATP-dependent RNA helicase RhlE
MTRGFSRYRPRSLTSFLLTTPSSQTRRPPRRRSRAPRASEPAAHSTIPAPVEPSSEFTVPDTEPLAFETLGFHADLISGIRDRGFAHTTPIQSAVLPLVRGGGDIVACAETGTGKTAAFVLPLVDRLLAAVTAAHAAGVPPDVARTRVLVLTPTRELAVQIDDDVQGFGYHAGVSSMAVYGGAPMEPQSRALAAGIPFVVATPGRLMDHMRSGTKFDGLETLVLDEADRMLDMGFWPDVRRIVDTLPAKRQTLLFSATMPNEILGFARAIMTDPALIQVGRRNAAARTISHAVEHIPTGEKTDWLAKFLRGAAGAAGPILVFVRTKRGADKLSSALASRGIRTAALHADRTQKDRLSAVEGFKSGRIRVLVATDIAARGLDIDGITHVVNYDVPHSAEAYVHRVGRTGRALATGHALTLVSPGEERTLKAVLASHAPPPAPAVTVP